MFAARGDDALIRRRLRSGAWVQLLPGVYGLPAPPSFERRLWVGHLAAGTESLVSHQAAGALWGYSGCPPNRAILMGRHSGWQRIEGVFVHQINDVLPHHRTTISRLPVTTRARTIVDLAAVFRFARLAKVLDDEVVKRTVSYVEVGQLLKEVTRRGKPGMQRLTLILDARGPGHVAPASDAERHLLVLLERAGEPPPERQYPFPGRQFTNGCVDSAYPQALMIIEVDSRSWHGRIADIKRDRDRDADAGEHGWYTHRVLAETIRDDPDGTVRTVRTIRRRRISQLHSTSTQ